MSAENPKDRPPHWFGGPNFSWAQQWASGSSNSGKKNRACVMRKRPNRFNPNANARKPKVS